MSRMASTSSARSPVKTALTYPPSPPSSRPSSESAHSLRALELSDDGPTSGPRMKRTRSTSVSTIAFDFQNDLLPLSLSETDGMEEPVSEKTVGLVRGIALIVGLQIGSGIFSSPGVVLANTNSVGASLIVWVVGGVLAWTGASSYAELGSTIPLSGGAQAYLAYAYSPLISFLFSWTAIAALKPGGNAIIALIFGEYVSRLAFHATGSDIPPDDIPQWAIKLTAFGAIVVVSALCAATARLGTRAAVVLTIIKIVSLVVITVIGVIRFIRGPASSSLTEPVFEGTSPNPSSYALALYSGLWAYDGWDQVNYVAGEVKNVEKNLPRAIHTSMIIVLILFLSTNLSYFVLLDKSIIEKSNTVALDFGKAAFGPIGGIIFSTIVAVSCFGALNGSSFTSARLIYVAGREKLIPSLFGRLHRSRKTPVNALCLQAALTGLFILGGGGFRTLINFVGVATWGFYFLTVLGLIVLRIKEPNLERPYKTYIITPLIFCAVALFLLCMPVVAAPLEALAALGFILVGIPIYYIVQSQRSIPMRETAQSFTSVLRKPFSWLSGRRKHGYERANVDGDETMEMTEDTR